MRRLQPRQRSRFPCPTSSARPVPLWRGRAGPGRRHRSLSLAGRGGALPPYRHYPAPAAMVCPLLGARLARPTPSGSGGSGRGDASHLTPRGGAGVGAMSRRERGPEPGQGGAEAAVEDVEPAEPESPDQCLSLLPWDRFSAWLHCVCVVGFDLELGQAVEVRAAAREGHSPRGLRAAAGPRWNRALPLAPVLHRGGESLAVLEETWLWGAPERRAAAPWVTGTSVLGEVLGQLFSWCCLYCQVGAFKWFASRPEICMKHIVGFLCIQIALISMASRCLKCMITRRMRVVLVINSVLQIAEVCGKVLYGFEAFSFSTKWMPAHGSVAAAAVTPSCTLCATGRDSCGTALRVHGELTVVGNGENNYRSGQFHILFHPVHHVTAANSWSLRKVSFSFSCFKGMPA